MINKEIVKFVFNYCLENDLRSNTHTEEDNVYSIEIYKDYIIDVLIESEHVRIGQDIGDHYKNITILHTDPELFKKIEESLK